MADARISTAVSARGGPPGAAGAQVASILVVLVLWTVAAWFVEQNFRRPQAVLPYPWQVIEAIPRLAVFAGPGTPETGINAARVLLSNSIDSASRLALGLLIGGACGIATGLVLGMSRVLRQLFELPLLLLRTIPLFALIPLFLAWFGGSNAGVVVYIAFGVFSMLLVNTLSAIENVSPTIQNFARTLGASRFHVYRTVVLPSIVPEVAGGVRVVIGIAWALLIGGELLGAQSGLGRILSLAAQFADTARMIIIVALVVIYTVLVDALVRRAVRRLTRWSPGEAGRAS